MALTGNRLAAMPILPPQDAPRHVLYESGYPRPSSSRAIEINKGHADVREGLLTAYEWNRRQSRRQFSPAEQAIADKLVEIINARGRQP